MEPLGTINSVYMYWPLPSLDHKQREDPVYYIGWLLGHEGAGSILSTLKSRQWATSILAGPGLQTTSHWLMQVRFCFVFLPGLVSIYAPPKIHFAVVSAESWIHIWRESALWLGLMNYTNLVLMIVCHCSIVYVFHSFCCVFTW